MRGELVIRTRQEQRVNAALVQSLRVLSMSNVELLGFLREAAVENPVLELNDAPRDEKRHMAGLTFNGDTELYQQKGVSLTEELISQIHMQKVAPRLAKCAELVVLSLDDHGYFTDDITSFASACGVSLKLANSALELVRSLEPAGVGARELSDCLALQLIRRGKGFEVELAIVRSHLKLVAKQHYTELAKLLGVSPERAEKACRRIAKLEPYPSRGYSAAEQTRFIHPDLYLAVVDGTVCLESDRQLLPALGVSRHYQELLLSDCDEETREYLTRKLEAAKRLIACVENRRSTLMRCAEYAVDFQKEYLLGQAKAPAALTRGELAKQLGLNVSTVSRAVKDKYLECDRGLLPLSSLFPRSLGAADADDTVRPSSAFVLKELEVLIRGEDPTAPLGDEALTRILNDRGVAISRRTVAKYRDSLGIPRAGLRKH